MSSRLVGGAAEADRARGRVGGGLPQAETERTSVRPGHPQAADVLLLFGGLDRHPIARNAGVGNVSAAIPLLWRRVRTLTFLSH
jgi:hypothetical protein